MALLLVVLVFAAPGPVRAGSLHLYYSTYLGGSGGDYGYGIAVDGSGNAYVTGYTGSPDFPTVMAFQGTYAGSTDVFVSKLDQGGTALTYSTYLGGTGTYGHGIAVDGSGSAYVTGETSSNAFPTEQAFQGTRAGYTDAFVSKLDPSGTALAYSTYLGGSHFDTAYGIAVDGSGNAYVTGKTSSTDFPRGQAFQGTFAGGSKDAFVSKLDPGGTALTYSTYLGGDNYDSGYGIAVDGSGNAYVTGETDSTNFPTEQAFQGTRTGIKDVFVSKLAPTGTALTYSTYLGGGGSEKGYGITVDSQERAYVTGNTYSNDFPTKNAFQPTSASSSGDAFVTRFDPSGTALSYSTYLGGNDVDVGNGIVVDASGNAYVTGATPSTNFPTRQAFQRSRAGLDDVFVTKLAPTGTSLTYSTYLGGGSGDYAPGIAIDRSGNAYVTGNTNSTDFPTRQAFQGTNAGGHDVFVFKIGMPSVGDELSVDFGANGLWHYDSASWSRLSTWNVDDNSPGAALTQWSGGLGADFRTNGLWNYNGTAWSRLSTWNGENNVAYGTGLAADFGASGLWYYNGSAWSRLSTWDADSVMVEWTGGLAADFGSNGLWTYNGTSWSRLTTLNAEGAVKYGSGLAVDFGANGLWDYDGATWSRLTTWNAGADGLAEWSGGLAADFDGNGLWTWNGASWSRLSTWDASGLEKNGTGLAADFGANGIWDYDGTTWSRLSTWDPDDDMPAWANGLAVDFGANGLWNYTGTAWSRLSTWDVDVNMVDCNLY